MSSSQVQPCPNAHCTDRTSVSAVGSTGTQAQSHSFRRHLSFFPWVVHRHPCRSFSRPDPLVFNSPTASGFTLYTFIPGYRYSLTDCIVTQRRHCYSYHPLHHLCDPSSKMLDTASTQKSLSGDDAVGSCTSCRCLRSAKLSHRYQSS